MNNRYESLYLEGDSDETVITTDKQCRNKRKRLRKKEERYKNNPSKELSKTIKMLTSEIREYENRNVVHKTKAKYKAKNNDESDIMLLNRLIKQKKLSNYKQEVIEKQTSKLWRKSIGPPRWSPKAHNLFPLQDKTCIKLMWIGKNHPDCILYSLPDEIIYNILSNIRWNWFSVEGNSKTRALLNYNWVANIGRNRGCLFLK